MADRKGATGTVEDLKESPPIPKAWVNGALIEKVISRLQAEQSRHSLLRIDSILRNFLFDAARKRYRIVWSKNMISSAGVSEVRGSSGQLQLLLHFRDGEDERQDNRRWMRSILDGVYAKGGRSQQAVEDFFYLTLVHEASEIHQRKTPETLRPDIKAEIRAEIEEAKAYLALPEERRHSLVQLYRLLDATADPRLKIFSRELELFNEFGEDDLCSIKGLMALIGFVISTPDYAREARLYAEERAKLQLARSLFVDVLHDFASASRADKWVRQVESSGLFTHHPVKYRHTENSKALTEEAADLLRSAANILKALESTDAELDLPGKTRIKQAVYGFNERITLLDGIKQRLALDEVIGIPDELRQVLEDNGLNRRFSYMDDLGIYHSLNLSRLDLRGLDLNSGNDERTASDYDKDINHQKDRRSDLRGAHMVGCDLSGRANFCSAKLDFALASYSDLSEIVFTGVRAVGMVLYGANASEGQFERAKMTAVDARGMSASFARIQMQETDLNGLKIWQSDVPNWQRAYVDILRQQAVCWPIVRKKLVHQKRRSHSAAPFRIASDSGLLLPSRESGVRDGRSNRPYGYQDLSRSSRRRILPEADLGISLTNSSRRICL